MEIGGKQYEQIVVATKDDEVLAVISDKRVIEEDNCKVILVPATPEKD